MEVVYLLLLIIGIVFVIRLVSEGENFKTNSQNIKAGMDEKEVISIMGKPSYQRNNPDGSYTFIYERTEWKGVFRGGSRTRHLEVFFSSNKKVISTSRNADCNMPGW